MSGQFIVIEGIDGAGTTTQAQLLLDHLRSKKRPAISTREPTGGPIGAMIRQALTHRLVVPGPHGPRPPGWQTMALLFAADRLDHLQAEITPNLAVGVTVLSDRYDLSSLAYQSAVADDDASQRETVAWIRELNRHARRPDLTLVVDVPAQVAAQRRRHRGGAVELYEHDDLQRRLAEAYLRAEELVPGDRVVHIDGTASVADVAAQIVAAVEAL